MLHTKCTCEYCYFVQDEEDDKDMEIEYQTAYDNGRPLFDSLKIGDVITYYHIPSEERNIVYLPEGFKMDYIKKFKSFSGEISFKNESFIEIDNSFQKITPAECFAWSVIKTIKPK